MLKRRCSGQSVAVTGRWSKTAAVVGCNFRAVENLHTGRVMVCSEVDRTVLGRRNCGRSDLRDGSVDGVDLAIVC